MQTHGPGRIQRKLKGWHIVFFLWGLTDDTIGTGIMSAMVENTGRSNLCLILYIPASLRMLHIKSA